MDNPGLNFLVRSIPDINRFLKQLEKAIRNKFIPAVAGGRICSDKDGKLSSHPTRYGCLAITIIP